MQMELELTLSPAASPAKISASPESAPALTATALGFGRITRVLLASYDPVTRLWKTCQACWLEGWSAFSETWPSSGSMRNGVAWAHPTLERRIDDAVSGLWPTPQAAKAGDDVTLTCSGDGRAKPNKLGWAVAMWPTPSVCGNYNLAGASPTSGDSLATAVAKAAMWPTPQARDHRSGQPSRLAQPQRHGCYTLNDGAAMWPPPTSSRRSGLQSHGENAVLGQLNPMWVEWLMGYETGWTELPP